EQKKLYEVKAFEQRMDDLSKQFASSGLNVKEWMNTALQNKVFKNILILADPDTGCNFDETTFRYADGRAADDIAFLKVNLFVRIWRKLVWSITETDRALQAFIPKNTPFDAAHLNQSPLKTALLYLAHLKTLDEQLHLGGQGRLILPVIWSKMATTGSHPLYAQLFLAPGVLKQDPVFDDPLGNYLSAAGTLVKDHLPALQGALELTADDISAILADNQQSIDAAALSLEQVSLLYRYGLLAKALNISIPELIVLKQLSGLDPFKALHTDPVTTLNEDHPLTQTLQFVKIADQLRRSGFKIEDLNYLLRHRFDPAGKYQTSAETSLLLMKQLADGINLIRSEHGIPDKQAIINEETLRQKLGLGLPPDAADRLLAMIKGTAVFTATVTGVAPADRLQPMTFEKEPAIIQVGYNETRQEQQLSFRGVLMEDKKGKMKTAFPSPVLAALLDKVQAQAYDFFINNFRKQALKAEDAAGFLDYNDFITLFTPLVYVEEGDTPEEIAERQDTNEHVMQQRYKRVAEAYYPFLQRRLIRQFTVQTLASQTGADAALVELLLTDLQLPTMARPLLEALTGAGDYGLNVDFFPTADGSGTALTSQVLADVNTASKPAGANSARFQGYITVPASGAYRFYIPLAKNMTAHLHFDHLVGPLLTGGAGASGVEVSTYTELKAGTLYHFTLDLQNLSNGDARLLVQSELLPKGALTQLRLYPHHSIAQAQQAVVLLTKVLQWIQQFQLTEREVRYLFANTADFDNLDLSKLPVSAKDSTPEKASAFFKQLLRMMDYTRARMDMAGDTDGLISVFEAATVDEAYTAIAQLTRRDALTVKLVATEILAAPAFKNERSLLRLWDALKITTQLGVAVHIIAGWTKIVSSAATPGQRFAIARDVKESLKARFDAEAWQRIAQSVFDKLRQRQRDALVAHVMQQHGFARADQLYEYFLIDPAMEPVVQTSRIRLAISSVQLFIQRCLLNLEVQVPPAVINTEQWEWMKQYRVWEANRKIFLFPENWLEPEFRDDKTHLYDELESQLLQGDIDNDLAEDAFLNYLKKLDELARLEMVGMYCEDNADPALNVLHVIGRTHSDPYKYFYRRYAQQMWTPWEPINAEITGDHIAPVIWRDRLYLFWVTFMDKPDFDAAQAANTASNGSIAALRLVNVAALAQYTQQPEKPLTGLTLSELSGGIKNSITSKVVVAMLHWSEYIRGEWSTQASGGMNVVLSANAPFNFTPGSVFIHVSKDYDVSGEESGVKIHLGSPFNQVFYLEGRNSPPYAISRQKEPPAMPYSNTGVQATRYTGSGALKVSYKRRITQQDGQAAVATTETSGILQKGNSFTLLPCDNDISLADAEIASLVKPFFYQDNREQTFFVEPELTEKTIEEWQEWVTNTPVPEREWELPDWWKAFPLTPTVPKPKPYIAVNPQDPVWKFQPDVAAAYQIKPDNDWLTNPVTALHYGDALVGPIGRANVRIQALATFNNIENSSLIPVNIQAGSQVLTDSTVVTTDHNALEIAGLATQSTTPLAVVGNSGLNATVRNNVQVFNTINVAKAIQFMNIK
ncbi:MAG TPA: neuraminidase-like domain-containing protein, partial [Chitinophaga sp.]